MVEAVAASNAAVEHDSRLVAHSIDNSGQRFDGGHRTVHGSAPVIGDDYRVGAMFALRAHYSDAKSPEESLRIGLDGGLTSLEKDVRTVLGLEP